MKISLEVSPKKQMGKINYNLIDKWLTFKHINVLISYFQNLFWLMFPFFMKYLLKKYLLFFTFTFNLFFFIEKTKENLGIISINVNNFKWCLNILSLNFKIKLVPLNLYLQKMSSYGEIEVIYGPMFSGKSS